VVVVILAEAAAHDAVFGHFAGQKNFNHVVKLHAFFLEGVPQLLGLHGIAGKTIKQPALLTLGLQGFQHHGNGDVIGYEVAAINVSLGFFAQLGAAADVFTEDGPGFDVGEVVLLLDQVALSAFAAAVRAKNKDIHWYSPCRNRVSLCKKEHNWHPIP